MWTFPRGIVVAFAIVAFAGIAPAGTNTASAQTAGKATTTASGLQFTDSKVGTGPSPKAGQTAVVHYTGCSPTTARRGRSSTARSIAVSRSNFRSASIASSLGGTKASPA